MPRCCGIDLRVRTLWIFVFLFSIVVLMSPRTLAQEQEKKLSERIMQPDMTLNAREQSKSFGGGKGFNSDSKANVKEFYFTQHFSAKEFQTKEFRSKNYWAGDFKFQTHEAAFIKEDSADKKQYATKSAEVKDARESGKTYDSRDYAGVRGTQPNGAAQGTLDAEHNKGPKTIDDVRELLNKNK
jgi:hypothetical protein